jgi:hypothetical protein
MHGARRRLRAAWKVISTPGYEAALVNHDATVVTDRRSMSATLVSQPDARTCWDRGSAFGDKFTAHLLEEYVGPAEPVHWERNNPYLHYAASDLEEALLAARKWRHHHGIEVLRRSGHLYIAYVGRVDAMLEMLDTAMVMAAVDPSTSSFLDLGAAEGYVVNYLFERGARDVDAVELSLGNIERMWMVRAYKRVDSGRIGRVDLQHAAWCRSLRRRYDVTLALGVIYHMENPLLFARNLYEATERVAIVESDTPSFPNNESFRGFGSLYLHRDQVTAGPDDIRYVTEMRPDRQALAEVLLEAGFSRVRLVPPSSGELSRYFAAGEKSMVVAER